MELSAKHHLGPSVPMTIAAIDGPMTRAKLKPAELSAIASTRSSRPTSSTMKLCRAGISNALIVPLSVARMISQLIVRWFDAVNHHSTDAWTSSSDCAILTSRSLSFRSATTPPYRESSSTGSADAPATTPTISALLDSCSASHPSPTDCIHVPMSDRVCPPQNIRKFRCLSGRNGLLAAAFCTREMYCVPGVLFSYAVPYLLQVQPGDGRRGRSSVAPGSDGRLPSPV